MHLVIQSRFVYILSKARLIYTHSFPLQLYIRMVQSADMLSRPNPKF